jgi:hypothetical protein
LADPARERVEGPIIQVVLTGISVTGRVPVFAFQQPIAEQPDVFDGQALPLAVRRVVAGRGIADQDDSVSV